ncbi:NifU family protein [Yinghuangia seranimata]|uniref:NifU family protein n=1 Tax=Yinghuangia seranimata TaxID=408067 RepID=UPI00248BC1B5|nr:NifU family protein [Yinghuangia seranimata]MDI2126086.1 NifU family protein [Yinghuangia seranimata]
MDESTVAAAVDELRRPLRADGADLVLVRADPRTALIELRLDLTAVGCADCVLPPDRLAQVVEAVLRRDIPEEFELVLHDPRRP